MKKDSVDEREIISSLGKPVFGFLFASYDKNLITEIYPGIFYVNIMSHAISFHINAITGPHHMFTSTYFFKPHRTSLLLVVVVAVVVVMIVNFVFMQLQKHRKQFPELLSKLLAKLLAKRMTKGISSRSLRALQ